MWYITLRTLKKINNLNRCRKHIRQKWKSVYDKKNFLIKLGIEENFLDIIKATYDNSIANIILNDKNGESFTFKIKNKTIVPTLTTPI